MSIDLKPATLGDNFVGRRIKTKNFEVPIGIKDSTIIFNPKGEQKTYLNFLTRVLAEFDNFPRTRDDLEEDDDFGEEFDTIETPLPDIVYNIPLERFLATRRWLLKTKALEHMNMKIKIPGSKILLVDVAVDDDADDRYVVNWRERTITVGELVWLYIMACQGSMRKDGDVLQTCEEYSLVVNFYEKGIECDLWMN